MTPADRGTSRAAPTVISAKSARVLRREVTTSPVAGTSLPPSARRPGLPPASSRSVFLRLRRAGDRNAPATANSTRRRLRAGLVVGAARQASSFDRLWLHGLLERAERGEFESVLMGQTR